MPQSSTTIVWPVAGRRYGGHGCTRHLGNQLQSTIYQMANHGASSLANSYYNIWPDSIKPLSAIANHGASSLANSYYNIWPDSIKLLSAIANSAYNFNDHEHPCFASYSIQRDNRINFTPWILW